MALASAAFPLAMRRTGSMDGLVAVAVELLAVVVVAVAVVTAVPKAPRRPPAAAVLRIVRRFCFQTATSPT